MAPKRSGNHFLKQMVDGKMRCRGLWCVALLVILLAACSPEKPAEDRTASAKQSFTFFGVGTNTRYTEDLRDRLGSQLGADAIERLSTINLSIEPAGLLAKYFPEIDRIDRALNQPPLGRRTRHKSVRLMYRYASQKNLPFDYVELLFSGYNRSPLMITIRSEKNLSDIRQTLEEKYGLPELIQLDEDNQTVYYWQNNRNYLLISRRIGRLGRAEYLIRIYYVGHLNELVDTEAQQRRLEEEKRRQAEGKAF